MAIRMGSELIINAHKRYEGYSIRCTEERQGNTDFDNPLFRRTQNQAFLLSAASGANKMGSQSGLLAKSTGSL